jgi:hypothetical protein
VFRLDVAKIDRNVAQWLYTNVSIVCSKCFIYFSRRMFASVSSGSCIYFCKYFRHMFQVF